MHHKRSFSIELRTNSKEKNIVKCQLLVTTPIKQ